jgi:hypothetical protein
MTNARRWRIVAVVAAMLVTIAGTNLGVATDANGRFRFPFLEAKAWKLEVRQLGYAPVTTDIEVRHRDTVSLAITLIPAAVPIAPVRVNDTDISPKLRAVGFERRRKLEAVPSRQFMTREQIERVNPISLSQLTRRMTGRLPSNVRGNCDNPTIYVDGALRAPPPVDPPGGLFPAGMARPLPVDDIPPSQVEGLEIYLGPQQVPREFKAAGSFGVCVLLIWTRQ